MTRVPPLPNDLLTAEEDLDQVTLARLYRLDHPGHLSRLYAADVVDVAKRKVWQGMITVVWAMAMVALMLSVMGRWQGW